MPSWDAQRRRSAPTTTPAGKRSGLTAVASNPATARKKRGGTVLPHGKMSPGPWRLSSRDAGWMMSTATTGKQETFMGGKKAF